jgi:hypothetical protein
LGRKQIWDKQKVIVAHEFEDENLAFVRDIFVFTYFTALSFIYLTNLLKLVCNSS